MSRAEALDIVLIASLFSLPAILGAGWLSDRIGRRRVMMVGLVAALCAAFGLFTVPQGAEVGQLQIRAILALGAHGVLLGGMAAYVTEIFPTRVRYTALSASYQAASVVGGSIAPLIGAVLVERTGTPISVAIYAAAMAIPAIIVLLSTNETCGTDMSALGETATPITPPRVDLVQNTA